MEFSKMHFLQFIVVIFLSCYKSQGRIFRHDVPQGTIAKTITVDIGGKGDFTSVQNAINSVPSNNNLWILIHIKAGIYNEKVVVPRDKPFIILQGESRRRTIIQWADFGSSTESATLILNADNFVATKISFKNTYNLGGRNTNLQWAPAATIFSDKVSFYYCAFHGVIDTLTDAMGRHYYKECYIEGAVDFIWGQGQSYFERSIINATTGILNGDAGYITAQGKDRPEETNGFVFFLCAIYGTGPVYLGRAYRDYATVVFKGAYMSNAVVPQGWSSWNYAGQEDKITFTEVHNSGPGADISQRVHWEKSLSSQQLDNLVNINNFINQDGWIQAQPFA